MRQFKNAGFTLIEIIVVLTIILILAAVLMPVFQKAKGAAGDTVCISNLRQLHVAYSLYAADNNDTWAFVQPSSPEILSYAGNQIFKCPVRNKVSPEIADGYDHYLNLGKVLPGPHPELNIARAECEMLRGADMPVLFDLNHSSVKARIVLNSAWVFFARKDGSVHRKPKFQFNNNGVIGDVPCNRKIETINY